MSTTLIQQPTHGTELNVSLAGYRSWTAYLRHSTAKLILIYTYND